MVDGEFYWRCCQAELIERVERMRAGQPRPVGAPSHPDGDRERVPLPLNAFEFFREGLRWAADLAALVDEAAALYPAVVWQRLLAGERVAMRAAETEWVAPEPGVRDEPVYRPRVFSGSRGGAEVEDLLKRYDRARTWDEPRPTHDPGLEASVHLDFRLVTDPVVDPGSGRVGAPFVQVDASDPPPAAGTVASNYDAVVRALHRWHERLPGGPRQELEVAVKVWATALLMREGLSFNLAMRHACEETNLGEVSQARFGQVRHDILRRVPEAEGYIGSRTRAEPGNATADAPEALAKSDAPIPPLQAEPGETSAYT